MKKIHMIFIQKLIGIVFLLFTVLIVTVTPEDATFILFTIPTGIVLLLSKKQIIS